MKKFILFFAMLTATSCFAQNQIVTRHKRKVTNTTGVKADKPSKTLKGKKSTPSKNQSFPISTNQKVDLGLSVYWCAYNVGAQSPEELGNHYAWGETDTKSTYSRDTYHINTKYNDIRGYDIYDAARVNMDDAWRMPTKKEYEELISKCKWSYFVYKGVSGYRVTGPNGKSIFFPLAGAKEDALGDFTNQVGYYWSSNIFEDDRNDAWLLELTSSNYAIDFNPRYTGCSIRAVCIK